MPIKWKAAESVTEQPYVGPRPFEQADKARFFARDREAEEIAALITAHPAVLLYASSGAGKTSLINTKLDSLLEALPAEVLPPVRVRSDTDLPASADNTATSNIFVGNVLRNWEASRVRPGQTLAGFLQDRNRAAGPEGESRLRVIIFDQFEEIFTSSPEQWRHRRGFFEQVRDALEGSPSTLDPGDVKDPGRLAARIAAGENPIAVYIRDRRAHETRDKAARLDAPPTASDSATGILIGNLNRVIQNAELYRNSRRELAPLTAEMRELVKSNERSRDVARLNRKLLEMAFPGEIMPCVDGDPLLRVLFAMREDYIAELDSYSSLLAERLQIRYRLERLRAPAAFKAVTGPIDALKERRADTRFEAGAAELLVDNLMGGEEFVEPVQLQVVCAGLWEAVAKRDQIIITKDDIGKFAGVTEALLKYYERCLAETTGADVREGELRRWFETKLITPSGTRGMVYKGRELTEGIRNRAVQVLDQLHLIKPEIRDGATWYELAHDRFIGPIQDSNRNWRSKRSGRLKILEERAKAWSDTAAGGDTCAGLLAEDELIQAEDWLGTSDAIDLGASEAVRQFVQHSRDELRRQRDASKAGYMKALKVSLAALAVTSITALIMASTARHNATTARENADQATKQKERAEAERAQARESEIRAIKYARSGLARGMVSDAWGFIETDPDISVNLAARATELAQQTSEVPDRSVAVSEQALRFSLRDSRVRVILPKKHAGGATVAAYNRASESRLIVTAGNDGNAWLWRVSDRNPWEVQEADHLSVPRDSKAGRMPINGAVFGPFDDRDNSRIALACGDSGDPSAAGQALVWFPGPGKARSVVELKVDATTDQGPVLAVAFSPDGKRVVTGDLGGNVRVWDAETGKLRATLPHGKTTGQINAVAFHPTRAELIAIASGDPNADSNSTLLKFNPVTAGQNSVGAWLWKWDSPAGASQKPIPLSGQLTQQAQQGAVTAIAFDPKGELVVTAGTDAAVRLWDIKGVWDEDKVIPFLAPLRGHTGPLSSAEFSPDGQMIVTAGRDQTARVWDSNTGFLVSTLRGHNAWIYRASFGGYGNHGPKGKFIVTASFDGTSRVFEARTGLLHASLLGHRDGVQSAEFSSDAQSVVTAGDDGTTRIWDVEPRATADFRGPDAQINVAAFSQDQRFVISAGLDCQAWIWETSVEPRARPKLLKTLVGHTGPLTDAEFSPDGKLAATASFDGTARVWDWQADVTETSGFRILEGHHDQVTGIAFSPKKVELPGSGPTWLVITAGRDGTIRLWNSLTGDELHPGKRIRGYTSWLRSAIFSPDGSQIVAPGEGIRRLHASPSCGAVFLEWSETLGTEVRQLPLRDPSTDAAGISVNDAVFSTDSSLCITASGDRFIRVWDTKNAALLTRLSGHYADVARLVLDERSSRLVSEARDGMGIVWDVSDLRDRSKDRNRIIARLTGLSGRYAAVAISPGGRWAVTEHGNLGARLWDLNRIQAGKIPAARPPRYEQGMISAVAFSPAPELPLFVTAGSDGSAWVENADPQHDKDKRSVFLAGLKYSVSGVAFSADGKLVAASSGDNRVRVWNSQTGAEQNLAGGSATTGQLFGTHPVFSPIGQWLVAGSSYGPFMLLHLEGKTPERKLLAGSTGITRAAFSADAKRIATIGYDRVVRIWETQTAKPLDMPKVQELSQRAAGLPLNCLAYRPDGLAVVLGWGSQTIDNEESARNSAVVYDVLSGEQIREPLKHGDPVNAAVFSPDGTMIVTVSGQVASSLKPDNTARLWQHDTSTNSWVQERVLDGHKEVVIGAAFSADSRFLVTASRDNTARVWKTSDGELLAVLDAHKGDVTDAAFSPDGRFILTSSFQDGTVRIWDVTTYQGIDGKEIARVARNRELMSFQGGYTGAGAGFTPGLATVIQAMGDVTSASFGSDSRTVITASGDGTARMYVCDLCGLLDDLVALAKRRPIFRNRQQLEEFDHNGNEKISDWSQYLEESREIEKMEQRMRQERNAIP